MNEAKKPAWVLVVDDDRKRGLMVESACGAASTDSIALSLTPGPIVHIASTERAIPGEAA